MVKFEFNMSSDDLQRIFALKREAGVDFDNYTANDYSELIFHKFIRQICSGREIVSDELGVRFSKNSSSE